MRIVVPIMVETDCFHYDEHVRFTLDKYGVTGMICDIHGNLNQFDKLEFDSEEEYEEWKAQLP